MALTPTEEGQIRDILAEYSDVLDLTAVTTQILAALGYGDVRVIDLPAASPLDGSEQMYLAQTSTDVKATAQQFGQFTFDEFVDPALDAALADFLAMINQALNEPKNYFYGQF